MRSVTDGQRLSTLLGVLGPMSSIIESQQTRVQPYKLTVMPFKKGFIHIQQDTRDMFPQESGKVSVELEGTGERQLTFDAKNNRVYGLTGWFRARGIRPGTIIAVEARIPFKKYALTVIPPMPGFEQRGQAAKATGIKGGWIGYKGKAEDTTETACF